MLIGVAAAGLTPAQAATQIGPPQTAETRGYPFSLSTDGPVADPSHHKVLFEDARVRLVEVTLQPGQTEAMHGNAYPAVIAIDGPLPKETRMLLDPAATAADVGGGTARAPDARLFPYCRTTGPEAPYAATNTDTFARHYYRIEFKRQDWPDLKRRWKDWYPWMAENRPTIKDLDIDADNGPGFSERWPFPLAFDSVKAAPDNHFLRFQDDHVRFIEVVIRAGETEPMHGHPYPSVFARDGFPLGGAQPPRNWSEYPLTPPGAGGGGQLVPGSPFNSPIGGYTFAPQGFEGPNCSTMDPEAPHKVHNPTTWPDHFYRLEYTKVRGDDPDVGLNVLRQLRRRTVPAR